MAAVRAGESAPFVCFVDQLYSNDGQIELRESNNSKCIVVVDEDTDVQNVSEVAWRALNNIDPQRDIEFVMGPVDSLDHASRLANYGSKMGIDATRKWPEEGFTRPWPGVIEMSPEIKRRVDDLWKQAGM